VKSRLFVSCDVNYENTSAADYNDLSQEIVGVCDRIVFMREKNFALYYKSYCAESISF